MSSSDSSARLDRRRMLQGAGAVTVAGALAGAQAAAADEPRSHTTGPLRVRRRLKFVDRHGHQRFLMSSRIPPVYVQGRKLPASERQGPVNGSWMIFNDEDQNEKGGLTASRDGVSLSIDYPNAQAATLSTGYEGKLGAARLSMSEMPDPDIPVEELTDEDVPQRVLLGCSNAGDGSLLYLFDHQGRPRITLRVDGQDVPRIQILDENGGVVAQLPDAPAAEAKSSWRLRFESLIPGRRRVTQLG